MRLRNIPEARDFIEESPYCVKDPVRYCGLWRELFLNKTDEDQINPENKTGSANRELWIEIGCGKGQFARQMALNNQNVDFLAIEMYASVLYKAVKRYENMECPPENLLFIREDAKLTDEMFGEGEVDRIFLNFSDPWPKARHEKRRLTSDYFLKKYQKILNDRGILEFKTDNADLFEYSVESINNAEGWEILSLTRDLYNDSTMLEGNVATEYEEKFVAKGNRINKLTAKFSV